MGVSATVVARTVGIDTAFKNLNPNAALLLPQRVALIGQGTTAAVYATTPLIVTSAATVGSTYGFGSPLHLAALQLLPQNGDGLGTIPLTVYPLADSGTAAAGTIECTTLPTSVRTFSLVVNGIRSVDFTIDPASDSLIDVATLIKTAVNATLNTPVIGGTIAVAVLDLDLKWGGTSGNDTAVSILGELDGAVFAIVQPTAGATNPSVQPALDQITSVWETLIVNCMELGDSTNLDLYSTWGEGRWDVLSKKPAAVHTGSAETVVATNVAIGNGRKTDRTRSEERRVGKECRSRWSPYH